MSEIKKDDIEAHKALMEERMSIVIGELCMGVSGASISKKYRKEWGVTEKNFRVLIAQATSEMVAAQYNTSTLDKINLRIKQMEFILEKTIKTRDYKVALKALELITKVQGAIYINEMRVMAKPTAPPLDAKEREDKIKLLQAKKAEFLSSQPKKSVIKNIDLASVDARPAKDADF